MNSKRAIILTLTMACALALQTHAFAQAVETEVKKLGPLPEKDVQSVAFSPDGEHLAYLLDRNGKRVIVRDGAESPEFDDVRGLTFSPNGKYLAYAASRERVWTVLVNDKEGEPMRGVIGPVFSPDGKHFVYIEQRAGSRAYVIYDGEKRTQYNPSGGVPVFSPDGRHLAYEARSSGTSARIGVRDPNRPPPPNEAPPDWVTDDGKEVDINSSTAPRLAFIVRNEEKGVRVSDVKCLVFSPNSKYLAYAAAFGDKWFIVCDDKKISRMYQDVGNAVFSPASRTIAFPAKWEDKWLVAVGKAEGPRFDAVGQIVFSPDSREMVYAAAIARTWFLVHEDKRTEDVTGLGPILFSPDGKHLAWVARLRGRQSVVVIDGVAGEPHDAIHVPDEATKKHAALRCIVADKGEARLVDIPWPKDTTWTTVFTRPLP